MSENSYKRREETPEEREQRLAKHKRTVAFIASKYFEDGESIEGLTFYTCKFCQQYFDSEQEAADHYFKNHHEHKKEGRHERRN